MGEGVGDGTPWDPGSAGVLALQTEDLRNANFSVKLSGLSGASPYLFDDRARTRMNGTANCQP
jgi:hypothetical protein